jgi:methanogenic corrinoid protein MtbC1
MNFARGSIVSGVIGVDAQAVGNEIIAQAWKDARVNVLNLGILVLIEDFIKAGGH